jgi:hypothetical protein
VTLNQIQNKKEDEDAEGDSKSQKKRSGANE